MSTDIGALIRWGLEKVSFVRYLKSGNPKCSKSISSSSRGLFSGLKALDGLELTEDKNGRVESNILFRLYPAGLPSCKKGCGISPGQGAKIRHLIITNKCMKQQQIKPTSLV